MSKVLCCLHPGQGLRPVQNLHSFCLKAFVLSQGLRPVSRSSSRIRPSSSRSRESFILRSTVFLLRSSFQSSSSLLSSSCRPRGHQAALLHQGRPLQREGQQLPDVAFPAQEHSGPIQACLIAGQPQCCWRPRCLVLPPELHPAVPCAFQLHHASSFGSWHSGS